MAIPCRNALHVEAAPGNWARSSTRRTPAASLTCWRAELSRASPSGAEVRGGQVVGERERGPLRLAAQVAYLDQRQAGLDLASRVARRHREGAETVATGDQGGPVRVVERRRRRLPGHEIAQRGSVSSSTSVALAVIDPGGEAPNFGMPNPLPPQGTGLGGPSCLLPAPAPQYR
jgi:hypothetical protein